MHIGQGDAIFFLKCNHVISMLFYTYQYKSVFIFYNYQRLSAAGVPLYFTAIAENSAGMRSQTSCFLPTYDVTLPDGRFQEEFKTTSNPDQLRAAVKVNEDSEINHKMVGVGYGKEIYGDQIVPWSPVSLDYRSQGDIGMAIISENKKY